MMGARRTKAAAWAAVAVSAVLVSGCGAAAGTVGAAERSPQAGIANGSGGAPGGLAPATASPSPSGGDDSDFSAALSFHYVGDSGVDETINQLLEIKNGSRSSVAPVLSFVALDKNHQVLGDVKVDSVYGSDRGNLVVPYGKSVDILRFSGPGEHDVADVRVTVRSAAAARIRAGIHQVTAQALDAQGRDVSKFDRFSAVRLTNQDGFAVSVRIAYILWDQPADGDTQQAAEVTPIGGLVEVPAYGSVVVPVTGDSAAAVARDSGGTAAVSLKVYNSQ